MVFLILLMIFLLFLALRMIINIYRYKQVLNYQRKALAVCIMVQNILTALAKLKIDNSSTAVVVELEKNVEMKFEKDDISIVITALINIVNSLVLQYKIHIGDNLKCFDENTKNCLESLNDEINELHRQLKIALWYENGI